MLSMIIYVMYINFVVMVAYIVSVNAVVIMGCECVSRHLNLVILQINCGFSFFLMSIHTVFTVINVKKTSVL